MRLNTENKSYKSILQAAKSLFWKRGIRKVTVEEICAEAGVSKMTFYRNFENKNLVAEHVLMKFFDEQMEEYRLLMGQETPYNEKIAQLLAHKRTISTSFSKEFLQDILHPNNERLGKLVLNFKEQSSKVFYQDMRNAQEEGWIRPEIKIEFFAHVLEMIQKEMSNEIFLNLFDDIEDANNEISRLLFYGVISTKNQLK